MVVHERFYFEVINTCYILQQLQEALIFSKTIDTKTQTFKKKRRLKDLSKIIQTKWWSFFYMADMTYFFKEKKKTHRN